MDTYMDLCRASSMPLWLAPLLRAAGRMKTDRARRRSAYRFIQRQLRLYRVGCTEDNCRPTYIYPNELKELIRAIFPAEVCNYPDPCNEKVYAVTLEDLHNVIPVNRSWIPYEKA